MAGISRKELKQDQFVAEVTKTVEYVQTHRDRLYVVVGAVLAVVVVAVASYLVFDRRSANANEALGAAMRTFNAPVRPAGVAPTPGEPEVKSFTTDREKYEAAAQDFRAAADRYGFLAPGKMARYYLGISLLNAGKPEDAAKELAQAAGFGDQTVSSLAKFALANAQTASGKNAEAETLYRQLAGNPSGAVGKIAAQLELARLLTESKPAEAEKIFAEIEAGKPAGDIMEQIRKGRTALKK